MQPDDAEPPRSRNQSAPSSRASTSPKAPPVTPLGVKLLEQEIKLQREEYKQKLQSDLDKVPFDNVRTRAYKKKIKADMKPGRSVGMGARTKRSAQEDRDVADLSISQAIDEVNRLSISLEMAERMGLTRSVPEIHTELGILERLLDEDVPVRSDMGFGVDANENADVLESYRLLYQRIDTALKEETMQISRMSQPHAKLIAKIHAHLSHWKGLCTRDMQAMSDRIVAAEIFKTQLEDTNAMLTTRVEGLKAELDANVKERRRLEEHTGALGEEVREGKETLTEFMATQYATKSIAECEISIYQDQISRLKGEKDVAVLEATKSLESDLVVAMSEWESMEQKLTILQHQVKKAQAEDSTIRLLENTACQTEEIISTDSGMSSPSEYLDSPVRSESNADKPSSPGTTLSSWNFMYVTVGHLQSTQWVICTMASIYNDAIANGRFEAHANKMLKFRDFIVEWHLQRYGFPMLAEQQLADFIVSLTCIARHNKHAKVFAAFCEIWDSSRVVYNEQISFHLHAMQCLAQSPEISILFPDEGHFWMKPLEVYEILNQMCQTEKANDKTSGFNLRDFIAINIEPLLDPVMKMYKAEDVLYEILLEWERRLSKAVARLEAYYRIVVPKSTTVLAYDEFSIILKHVDPDIKHDEISRIYMECFLMSRESKVINLDSMKSAALKYGVGLWRADTFSSMEQSGGRAISRNIMPNSYKTDPLFHVLDSNLKSKFFVKIEADVEELKVKLETKSMIVRQLNETHEAFRKAYIDRVDAETAWALYRKLIAQIESAKGSSGHFWTRQEEASKELTEYEESDYSEQGQERGVYDITADNRALSPPSRFLTPNVTGSASKEHLERSKTAPAVVEAESPKEDTALAVLIG